MSAITVTKANVRPLNGAWIIRGVASGVMYKGDVAYLNSSGSWVAATAAATTTGDAKGVCVGIAGTGTVTAAGDPVDICVKGPITGYSSMTIGALCFASSTIGRVDTSTGSANRCIGYALTASEIYINIGHPANVS